MEPGTPTARSLKLAWTVIFGLMLCAWVIYLAGIAASQQACTNLGNQRIASRMLLQEDPLNMLGGRRSLAEAATLSHGRQLLASTSERCGNDLSFAWWTVWFDVVVIGVAIMSALMAGAHQNVAIIFMTIETTILMVVASSLNSQIFNNKDAVTSKAKDLLAANRCAMAGNVMLMVFNLIYLIAATESSGAYAPALGGVSLPSLPKFTKSGDATAGGASGNDGAPPVTGAATGAPAPHEALSAGGGDPTLAAPPADAAAYHPAPEPVKQA